VQSANVP